MNILDLIGWQHQKGRTAFVLKLALFIIIVSALYFEFRWFERLDINDHYINAILFYLAGNLIINICRFVLSHIYLAKQRRSGYGQDNFLFGLTRIASIINFIIFVAAVFLFFDIDYKSLFTSLSIIAAAIAILSKDYISNMINGMIIMFTDQVSLGDFVKIGEYRGTVVDITFVNIHLLDENGDLVFFPNAYVFQKEVVNYSKRDVNKMSIYFDLDIKYLMESEKLEEYLTNSIKKYQGFIKPGTYFLRTVAVKKDQVDFNFQYVIKKHDVKTEKEIRKTVMRSLVDYLKKERDSKLL